jgi:hypothetical protein
MVAAEAEAEAEETSTWPPEAGAGIGAGWVGRAAGAVVRFANNEDVGRALSLVTSTYRLVVVSRVTPADLYQRKIGRGEYRGALRLAGRYGLDTDLVYQDQWRRDGATDATAIGKYLDHVADEEWVLSECAACIPLTPDAVRKLLKYGLARTAAYEGASATDPQAERAWDYRRRYLRYLDRLRTFCLICDRANVDFCADDYAHFRDADLLDSAKVFAGAMRFEAVDALFTHHGAATLPHRTAILEAIPETCAPFRYAALLPAAESATSTHVAPWPQEPWRARDWVETPAGPADPDRGAGISVYDGPWMTIAEAAAWFRARALECDARAGQVDAVLSLVDIAIANQIPGLDDVHAALQTLAVLVYDAACADPQLSLAQYMPLPVVARFMALFTSCRSDAEFATRMRRHGAKFLSLACGGPTDAVTVLGALLMHYAEAGHVSRVRAVLQNHATMFPTRRFPESVFPTEGPRRHGACSAVP